MEPFYIKYLMDLPFVTKSSGCPCHHIAFRAHGWGARISWFISRGDLFSTYKKYCPYEAKGGHINI